MMSASDLPKQDLATPDRRSRMEALLRAAFRPVALSIEDDSARHAGHAGAAPGGETHFTIRIVSEAFIGLSRVSRSRAVHTVLGHELQTGLHALVLILRSPDEILEEN
jgi:BolA family transcriptional regulator, general stress-responsive regulator